MKSITKTITLEKEFWIKVQNQALQYLQSKQIKNINQAQILDEATNTILFFEKFKLHEELLSKYQDTNIYLSPILINKEINIEKAMLEYKVYYIPLDEYKNFNLNLTDERPYFKLPNNYNEQINTFVDSYIKNFAFKKDVTDKIKLNNEVGIEINKINDTRKDKIVLIASNKDKNSIEFALLDKKVGEKFNYSINEDQTFEITILNAKEIVREELNDNNVYKLNIDQIKTLEQAKQYVYKTIQNGMIDESLVAYGFQIVEHIVKLNNKQFNLDQDLINSKIAEIDPQKLVDLNSEEIANSIFDRFIAQWILVKLNNIDVTQLDINNEINKINASMTPEEARRINIRKVIDIILIKKIALIYLQKYDPNTYKQYFDFK